MIPPPIVEPLPESLDAEQCWLRLCDRPHVLFLDSVVVDDEPGRYSFVAADPFEYHELPTGHNEIRSRLERLTSQWTAPTVPELPPFQGGVAGVFAYELGRSIERVPSPRFDEFAFPAFAVGLYDVVLAFDHAQHRGWLISHGFPATADHDRVKRARRRAAQFRDWLARSTEVPVPAAIAARSAFHNTADRLRFLAVQHGAGHGFPPRFPQGFSQNFAERLVSDFSRDGYLAAVRRAVDYINAGDVFQVNLSQRLLYPADCDAIDLYRRLRRCNPAPFAGYFDTGLFQVVSASPERFLQVRGGRVEARPIKGTRRRSASPEADLYTGDELLASEKDRAENTMIVDLLRNDLSTVCDPDSVRVEKLCGLEVYEYVQHLVSVISGRLAEGRTPFDLLWNAFPGGSITGAPKVRAMEIIAELEPTARGPYCGCLGYLGFDGAMDLNILIRTITAGEGWWQLPVGGGVVAQSNPRGEYEETWHKAAGMLRALAPGAVP
ncbi:MAG: anthranilate synthase component I family protein [Planctomycetota bacterium]